MPSNAYSTELRPDPLLRAIVLASGFVLGLLGLIAIIGLPWSFGMRTAAVAGWAGWTGRELARLHGAWRNCRGLRLEADGGAKVVGADGRWQPAAVLPGGILLRRAGWIRLRTQAGTVFAEPLRGSCREDPDWRRLQVLWRHVGADD